MLATLDKTYSMKFCLVNKPPHLYLFLLFFAYHAPLFAQNVNISGEMRRWHPVELTLTGPSAQETDNPSPFLQYRFDVTFQNGGTTVVVPGFFAADGNAEESSATSGNKWRAIFTPGKTGTWSYTIRFREGSNVAVSDNPLAGTATSFDGISGTFNITETNKSGRDFRGKGPLRYVGEHYQQFDNGEWFLKVGTDSPENFLAFEDFDGTYNGSGTDYMKTWSPHVQDWNSGDPTWKNGKGKGIIGAVNYLSEKGVNSQYFLTLNAVSGDTKDIWPWTGPTNTTQYDVSKLAQWDIVFQHMQKKGVMMHVVLQDDQDAGMLDNGDLGTERKLYYRELIARFGYHPAIIWNLGEETNNTTAQLKSFTDFFQANDPYGHLVQVHTLPGGSNFEQVYAPLLGYDGYGGISFQIHNGEFESGGPKTYNFTRDWLKRSEAAGQKWVIAIDECCGYRRGVEPLGANKNLDDVRKNDLWGSLMAGGAGMETYFGTEDKEDFNVEDFRPWAEMFDYMRYAEAFFQTHVPFQQLEALDDQSVADEVLVMGIPGSYYLIYLKNGGTKTLNITGEAKNYDVMWFDPRNGGALQQGSKSTVSGPGSVGIGQAPSSNSNDWVAIVKATDFHLPVELTRFDALVNENEVILTWETANELNNAGFEVQRRLESGEFVRIAFVDGMGTTTIPHSYQFIDLSVPEGVNKLQYRLKQVDFDGTSALSSVQDVALYAPSHLVLHRNYPNPFNPVTTFAYELPADGQARVDVYDMQGRHIQTLIDQEQKAGRYEVNFDASNLASGLYLYRISANGFSQSQVMHVLK